MAQLFSTPVAGVGVTEDIVLADHLSDLAQVLGTDTRDVAKVRIKLIERCRILGNHPDRGWSRGH